MGNAFRPNLHFIFPRQIETFIKKGNDFIASVGEGFSYMTIKIISQSLLVFFDVDQVIIIIFY